MQHRQVLIKLAPGREVHYPINPDEYPTCTHAMVMRADFNISRSFSQVPGSLLLYLGYGYMKQEGENEVFYEATGLSGPGGNDGVHLGNDELMALLAYTQGHAITPSDILAGLVSMTQYCVDIAATEPDLDSLIDGEVVFNVIPE